MPAPPAQHILICFHDFAPGGTERVALVLAREWVAAGREVTILCGLAEGPSRGLVDPRIRVVQLDPPIPRSPTSRLGLGRAMAARIDELKPDAVFLPGNFHFGIARAFKRAAPGLPVVAKVSNPLLPTLPALARPLLQPLARRLLGTYVRPIDALIYMAPELAKAEAAELERTRDLVIAEPNLPAEHTPVPRGEPSDPPTVLVIGRMEPQKNLALALRAFARLRHRRPARLVVLGEGSQRPRLEALARDLGIAGDVAMPGYSAETERHLASASALLLTSRFEGYPAVVIEALAADVPVVATACTPVLDSLLPSGMHGRIVPENTPRALAEALDAVLGLPFASGGLRPAGVAHHDAAASARAYLDLFDRLAL